MAKNQIFQAPQNGQKVLLSSLYPTYDCDAGSVPLPSA